MEQIPDFVQKLVSDFTRDYLDYLLEGFAGDTEKHSAAWDSLIQSAESLKNEDKVVFWKRVNREFGIRFEKHKTVCTKNSVCAKDTMYNEFIYKIENELASLEPPKKIAVDNVGIKKNENCTLTAYQTALLGILMSNTKTFNKLGKEKGAKAPIMQGLFKMTGHSETQLKKQNLDSDGVNTDQNIEAVKTFLNELLNEVNKLRP